jgi:hypothetical protein
MCAWLPYLLIPSFPRLLPDLRNLGAGSAGRVGWLTALAHHLMTFMAEAVHILLAAHPGMLWVKCMAPVRALVPTWQCLATGQQAAASRCILSELVGVDQVAPVAMAFTDGWEAVRDVASFAQQPQYLAPVTLSSLALCVYQGLSVANHE